MGDNFFGWAVTDKDRISFCGFGCAGLEECKAAAPLKLSRFTRQALGDIARIADHYDREKDGLGDEFVERVDDRIEANPEGYTLAFRQLRRCNLRKFP
jgi:hypothetical protein